VIGAGIGGLVSAAALARAGLEVTALEAHIYAGGCAGTFYHQGYRFDAGATLAGGFYTGGPMDQTAKSAGIESWNSVPSQEAMLVHMPAGRSGRRPLDQPPVPSGSGRSAQRMRFGTWPYAGRRGRRNPWGKD
jgi:protoporphyrinogen oxidase